MLQVSPPQVSPAVRAFPSFQVHVTHSFVWHDNIKKGGRERGELSQKDVSLKPASLYSDEVA